MNEIVNKNNYVFGVNDDTPQIIQMEYNWRGDTTKLEFFKHGKKFQAFELIRITKPIQPFSVNKPKKKELYEIC